MLHRVRTVRLALDDEVLIHAIEPSIDGNLVHALQRARTELTRVELQLEAELREGARELTCVECGHTSGGDTKDWKAYLTIDDEVAIYCPTCCTAFEVWLDP